MVMAEEFQGSVKGQACVHFMRSPEGYFVPFRGVSDELMVNVFCEITCSIYSIDEFAESYPDAFKDHSLEGIEESAPATSTRVYFIGDGEFIKIGISKHPHRRLREIQTGHPRKLSILHIQQGGRREEFDLHCRFNDFRANGEWFKDCGPIREYLAVNDNVAVALSA